ncbi:MAG: TlyA family RNA methyltransferase [Rhizobium sp.]|nr:TlyA family RNA methyltransferase [Rhizobium sp.]
MPQQRLDHILVQRGLFESRSRARDAVDRGTVTVAGGVAVKAGQLIEDDAEISVDDPAQAYVSRGALKLIAALDHFGLSPDGLDCLDVGASTGGFTQVLLERGAKHVMALDVGHAQLASKVAEDPRVTNLEGINSRELAANMLDAPVQAIVADVSFISLKLALPPALEMAEPGSWVAMLVKPQFEAGRENVGKGGMLRDPSTAPDIADDLESWLNSLGGWQSLGVIPSPITGADGNREFLLAGRKS